MEPAMNVGICSWVRSRRPGGAIVVPLWLAIGFCLVVPAGAADGAGARSGFRRLAPGVLTVIPPNTSSDYQVLWRLDPDNSAGGSSAGGGAEAGRRDADGKGERREIEPLELFEVTRGLAEQRTWTPKRAAGNSTLIERAKGIEFPRDIWCLEFAFKPPRFIDVDVPVSDLKMRRKKIWYLVYRVRNTGGRRTVIDPKDRTQRTTESFETPVRFVPHFVLESLEGLSEDEGEAAYRGYLDRVIPGALSAIRRREDPDREFFDSASMSASDIPPGGERWGVAMWEDVDPRIDFFTISIRGLTNAIRWRLKPDASFDPDTVPASKMDHALASLRLDFWRPGDDVDEVEEDVHVGYAGMFERLALGSRLLEAAGRQKVVQSRPVAGLADLGLSWSELAEAAERPPEGSDLAPLAKVVRKLAGVAEPTARGRIVKAVFGDLALEYFEQLSRGLAAPVPPAQDAARRQALAALDLTPEAAAQKPLESLAMVLEALDETPRGPARRRRSEAFFGPAAVRVASLSKELAASGTAAVLDELEVDPRRLETADALAAFNAIQTAVNAREDAGGRERLLVGLFGPRGPALYAAATKVAEGIDHSWVLRYEIDMPGP
jgi:hypothetical protein